MKRMRGLCIGLCLVSIISLTGCRITINGKDYVNNKSGWNGDAEFAEAMEEWGEDFGDSMEEWGEGFGDNMESWGMNFGKSMSKLGNLMGKSYSSSDNVPANLRVDGSGEFVEEYNGEEVLNYNISMRLGEMTLSGLDNEDQIIKSEYTYNNTLLEPFHSYSNGEVKIVQKKESANLKGKAVINTKIHPTAISDFVINAGVGEMTINFDSVNVRKVDLDLGVGDLKLQANGTYSQDQNYIIDGGVGDMGMELNGVYDYPVNLDVDTGVGDFEVNLTGDFKQGGNVKVDTGVGDIDIKISSKIGFIVQTDGLDHGTIYTQGDKIKLSRNSKEYKSSNYDSSKPNFEIVLNDGVGDITITVVD